MSKRVMSIVVSLLLVVFLCVGVALASPGNGKEKGYKHNGGGGNGKVEITTKNSFKMSSGKINTNNKGFELKNGKIVRKSENGNLNKMCKTQKCVLNELKQKLEACNKILSRGVKIKSNFSDTGNHWAGPVIEKMSAIGLLNGYDDGTFRPDASITQDEAVVLIMRITSDDTAENKNGGTPEDEPGENEDEPGDAEYTGDEPEDGSEVEVPGEIPGWAKGPVMKAARKGLINMNRFHSQVQASRVQVAVMIAKALGLKPVDVADMPFKDGTLISPEDAGYVMALYKEGIIKGTPGGMFNPNSAITRAEMAVILERIVSNITEDDEDQDDAIQEDETVNDENPLDETQGENTGNDENENDEDNTAGDSGDTES